MEAPELLPITSCDSVTAANAEGNDSTTRSTSSLISLLRLLHFSDPQVGREGGLGRRARRGRVLRAEQGEASGGPLGWPAGGPRAQPEGVNPCWQRPESGVGGTSPTRLAGSPRLSCTPIFQDLSENHRLLSGSEWVGL